MKILVVDDEEDMRILFEQHFKNDIQDKLFEFSFAQNGEAAIHKLMNDKMMKIMLILSDIQMPGMNGFELLSYVRTHFPYVTVFMLTAFGDEKNIQKAWELGAEQFITKPLNFSYLRKVLLQFKKQHDETS